MVRFGSLAGVDLCRRWGQWWGAPFRTLNGVGDLFS